MQHADTAAVVSVEVMGAYSLGHLIARWRHAVWQAVLGPVNASLATRLPQSDWPASTVQRVVRAREILGDDYEDARSEAITQADRRADSLRRVIELTVNLARRQRCVLVLDHLDAPRHTQRHPIDPSEVVWQIRSLAQHEPHLGVIIVVAEDQVDVFAGPDAAFYEDGRWLTVASPTPSEWGTVFEGRMSPDFAELRSLSTGHVPSELALTAEVWRHPDRTLSDVFERLAATQHQHARRCRDHAASLHRLGVHTLTAIARQDRRYAINDRSDRIAEANRRLYAAGLIRPAVDANRVLGWQLVDPFVARLLRGAP